MAASLAELPRHGGAPVLFAPGPTSPLQGPVDACGKPPLSSAGCACLNVLSTGPPRGRRRQLWRRGYRRQVTIRPRSLWRGQSRIVGQRCLLPKPTQEGVMSSSNYYDVTTWPVGDPSDDVGEVINSIIADIKCRQTDADANDGGKPGAAIYIPPGDYRLRTQVVIDISFLKIHGSGHGFASSSIRFNVPEDEWSDLHELWPGGSRILVDIPLEVDEDESKGAAFYVERSGRPTHQLGRVLQLLHRRVAFQLGRLRDASREHLRQRQDRHLCRELQ